MKLVKIGIIKVKVLFLLIFYNCLVNVLYFELLGLNEFVLNKNIIVIKILFEIISGNILEILFIKCL